MDKLYQQSDTMLWRDIVAPGHQKQYDNGPMESSSESDFDSDDDSIDIRSEYTDIIDVDGVFGKSIAVWTYTRPDSLTLFTPRPDDTLYELVKYARCNLGFNRDHEKIMVMDPGDKAPREMKEVYILNPGSVVMVMPGVNINVMVEVNQLKTKFPISVDSSCTVLEVKAYIRRVKGIAIDQQDILYKDKVLENARRLFEYKVRKGTTLHVLIQVHFDLLVNVETFWGKTYRLYVDRCSTGSDVISTIFERTFSKHGPENVTVHELYVPVHVLILQHNKHSIHWEYCLGFFGIKNGDTLTLSTVGKQSYMNMQTITVVTELGETFEVTVSHFDRWAVVAFMVHGLTDVPVDLIRLFRNEQQVDFTSMIGDLPRKTVIMMNIVMTKVEENMTYGIPIRISLGNGIVENIKLSPMKRVRDIKIRLEDIGVHNALLYELTTGDYKLPNNAYLKDVIRDLRSLLFLKVEKFPIFVHAPDGIIYKTMVDVNHTLNDLKHKIELKSGHAMSTCHMIMAGQECKLSNKAILYENNFSTRSSLFIVSTLPFEIFFVTKGDLLVKLKLPIRPMGNDIKEGIWKCQDIPEGSITCLQTFFFWFYNPRINKKNVLPSRKKHRKRLPAAVKPLHEISDRLPRNMARHDEEINMHKHRDHKKHVLNYKPSVHDKSSVPKETTNASWSFMSKGYFIPDGNLDIWEPNQYTIRSQGNPMKSPRKAGKRSPHDIVQHVTPRWMDNLYQKHDRYRLDAGDNDGLLYREKLVQDPMATYQAKKHHSRQRYVYPVHNQGDASNAKFFQQKPTYDRQEIWYGSPQGSVDDNSSLFSNPIPRITMK